MKAQQEKPVGLTKDVGWQIGVRRTLPIQLEVAWRLVTSPEGMRLWLGEVDDLDLGAGASYELEDGTTGEMRVFHPNSHLRITWHPPAWPRASTIQVRTIPKGDRCVIAFHQEHMPGQKERDQRRAHFAAALDALEVMVSADG